MRGVVVALIVAWAVPVAAQDPAEDVDAARAHYAAGTTYFQADRLGEALHEFERAYALSRRPALLYNIGLCHEGLNHLPEAITAYQRYLESGPAGDDRIDAEARIARLKTARPDAPTLVLPVKPPPPAKKPLVRRGWFWGVMAGAVVVVAGAVVVGVVVGTRDTTTVLPDAVAR